MKSLSEASCNERIEISSHLSFFLFSLSRSFGLTYDILVGKYGGFLGLERRYALCDGLLGIEIHGADYFLVGRGRGWGMLIREGAMIPDWK